jgi:hypothetical protein
MGAKADHHRLKGIRFRKSEGLDVLYHPLSKKRRGSLSVLV